MGLETEIKLIVREAVQLERIVAVCCEKTGNTAEYLFQTDEYFDTPDGLLKRDDITVRLRRVNSELHLAIKSPRVFAPDKSHSRVEIEFNVPDEDEIRDQIARNGLMITTVIEKKRQTFHLPDAGIALDRLPFIGNFIEIESNRADAVQDLMELFGLAPDDAIRENYTELLEAHLSQIGVPTTPKLIATFVAEESFKATA